MNKIASKERRTIFGCLCLCSCDLWGLGTWFTKNSSAVKFSIKSETFRQDRSSCSPEGEGNWGHGTFEAAPGAPARQDSFWDGLWGGMSCLGKSSREATAILLPAPGTAARLGETSVWWERWITQLLPRWGKDVALMGSSQSCSFGWFGYNLPWSMCWAGVCAEREISCQCFAKGRDTTSPVTLVDLMQGVLGLWRVWHLCHNPVDHAPPPQYCECLLPPRAQKKKEEVFQGKMSFSDVVVGVYASLCLSKCH